MVRRSCDTCVSPGLTPRPSLSGRSEAEPTRADDGVSPGLTPRPSLSAGGRPQRGRRSQDACRRGSRPGLR